jgi:hypothetical protein
MDAGAHVLGGGVDQRRAGEADRTVPRAKAAAIATARASIYGLPRGYRAPLFSHMINVWRRIQGQPRAVSGKGAAQGAHDALRRLLALLWNVELPDRAVGERDLQMREQPPLV